MKYNCKNKLKYIVCFLCACMSFVWFIPQVSAVEAFDVQYSSDLCFSEEDWWDRGVQYGRLLLLDEKGADGEDVLLATHCMLNSGLEEYGPGYPVYRSADGGRSWEKICFVTDEITGLNSEWNPHLFELEKPCGKYPAGTVILAACSVDAGHNSQSAIRLYFSLDGGYTFSQGVVAATGGGLDDGVWEPFLMQLEDGRLVCFYSDDTDSFCSQKIVYKVSADGENWGDAVDVVASAVPEERPGMPVVTRLGDGSYFMVYEVVDRKDVSGNPVCFRRSKDGLDWGDPTFIGEEIITKNSKKALGSAPFCSWTPVGGDKGTLVVSGTFMRKGESSTGTDLFVSYDCGSSWKAVPHIIPYTAADHVGYSNSFVFSADGKTVYAINNPENPEIPEKSKMVVSVAQVQENSAPTPDSVLLYAVLPVGVIILICLLTVLMKKRIKRKP